MVLEAVGDRLTLDQGQDIHLTLGGDWREDVVGTNGIGTALADRTARAGACDRAFLRGHQGLDLRCRADPRAGDAHHRMGVVDISGPPSTYQRNNLTLAVTTARQIELALAERAALERMRLLEVCLQRYFHRQRGRADRAGSRRAAGACDRPHPRQRRTAQRVPGLDRDMPMRDWPDHLPAGWRPEWFSEVSSGTEKVGAVLVIPGGPRPIAASHARRALGAAWIGERSGAQQLRAYRRPRRRDVGGGRSGRASCWAGRAVPVLTRGETGVGKELLARAIHG